jgi:hypothetical protein
LRDDADGQDAAPTAVTIAFLIFVFTSGLDVSRTPRIRGVLLRVIAGDAAEDVLDSLRFDSILNRAA